MLPPRGDPTSGLRADLHAILGEPLGPRGALSVFLGATAAPPRSSPIITSGNTAPTASQSDAACALEGTHDLVAVCGPPGCGKTALLHHVAAQTVVACALGTRWTNPPAKTASWSLVVTSTNNAAVDHALAPFVSGSGLPVAIRLGNRRTLAEATVAAITSTIELLETRIDLSLPDARAAFESRAANARAFMREHAEARAKQASADEHRRALEQRAIALRAELALIHEAPQSIVSASDLESAETALREHAEAAALVTPLHLEGENASAERAGEKWARANTVRAPRILPVLETLGIAQPFRRSRSREST